jgi:hypothetical protein
VIFQEVAVGITQAESPSRVVNTLTDDLCNRDLVAIDVGERLPDGAEVKYDSKA